MFREAALEKLASPERFDQTFRVAVGALLAAAAVRSALGHVPTTVSGGGVLVNRASPMEVVAAHGGTPMDVKLQAGAAESRARILAKTAAGPALSPSVGARLVSGSRLV